MTLNVASVMALVLCLTVTSGQQGMTQEETFLLNSETSFTTETSNEVTYDKHEIRMVSSVNDENDETIVYAEDSAETKTVEKVTEEVTEEKEYNNRWGIELSEEEIELLAKILWVEARGESSAGQQAVVEVIFNRIISEEFPDDLYEVLSQKNPVQFCSWKLRDTAAPTEKEYESIHAVLNGQTSIVKTETVYFATKKLTRNLDLKIGGHYFCY